MSQSYQQSTMQLVTNNYKQGQKVLTTMMKQLAACDSFVFSVAFITRGGVASMIHELKRFNDLNKKGIIITTDYLMFNEPSALKKLASFDNIELRVIDTHAFHIKGYIFKHQESADDIGRSHYIIGSSNLTQQALTSNLEWNAYFTSDQNEAMAASIQDEVDYLMEISKCVDSAWLDAYALAYNKKKQEVSKPHISKVLIPNKLQQKGLRALELQRLLNHRRALVISATGTGKTYLSAFDAHNVNPKRLLFVVHREQIAINALESFQDVFQNEKTYGLYTGSTQQKDAEYLFATVQTLSKEQHYTQFDPKTFDYIVFDEAHHLHAPSYQRLLHYFDATFTLAMTATPERSDNVNIYQYLDHNIAFEIRLNEALEADMLCPFHYYGVSDMVVNGKSIDDYSKFNDLISEQRVDHILNKLEFYGYEQEEVKGLIFCSRVQEAKALSERLNQRGLKTLALSGDDPLMKREAAIEQLSNKSLDYILTVDIFNEGVDIPHINQIVMLRPTQSAIVFVQQLGRGLRKIPQKEFVIVIDFIGNYKNNFFIPIALSGDRTFDQETLRKYVKKGNSIIPGESSLHFERVVEKRVLESVWQTNFATKRFIKEAYDDLRFKLNKIPMLLDFYRLGSMDPRVIMQWKNSYDDVLSDLEIEYQSVFDKHQKAILVFLYKEILFNKRKHEVVLLRTLLRDQETSIDYMMNTYSLTKKTTLHALSVLSLAFYTKDNKEKYGNQALVALNQDKIEFSDSFKACMTDTMFEKLVIDVVDTAYEIIVDEYAIVNQEKPFKLYGKYTRKDVSELLEWEKDRTSTMFGCVVTPEATPIFITYNKDDTFSKTTRYEDKIIDAQTLTWYTKSNKTLSSKDVLMLKKHKETKMKIDLFIKKDRKEIDFFYVGEVEPMYFAQESIVDDHNNQVPIVRVDMKFKDELHDDMLGYFVEQE